MFDFIDNTMAQAVLAAGVVFFIGELVKFTDADRRVAFFHNPKAHIASLLSIILTVLLLAAQLECMMNGGCWWGGVFANIIVPVVIVSMPYLKKYANKIIGMELPPVEDENDEDRVIGENAD